MIVTKIAITRKSLTICLHIKYKQNLHQIWHKYKNVDNIRHAAVNLNVDVNRVNANFNNGLNIISHRCYVLATFLALKINSNFILLYGDDIDYRVVARTLDIKRMTT